MDNDIYVINLMQENVVFTTYAFVGDTSISREEFQQKRDTHLSYLKQHLTVTEDIWQKHSSENFENVIMIQEYILPEDTIYAIKLKLFHAMQSKATTEIGVEDLYLYCERLQSLNVKHVYQLLTNNKREVLTKEMVRDYVLNYTCVNAFESDKDGFTFDEFINEPLVNSTCGFTTPLGYNHLQSYFTANPNKITSYDINRWIKKDIVYQPKQLLLEVGQIKSNTLYVCIAETLIGLHKEKGLEEMYTFKLFYPELYRRQITTQDTMLQSKIDRYEKTKTQYAQIKPQFSSLTAIHDIYKKHKDHVPYSREGIKDLKVIYHPPLSFDIPIHLIFKIIHSSNSMPMVKFNPGKKQENLYRLFTDERITENGRQLPILPRSKLLQLIKLNTSKQSVVCYCMNKDYLLTFEFNSLGDIIIHYTTELTTQKQSILKPIEFIEEQINEHLTPILTTINSVITQSGIQYTIFDSVIYNPYIEVLNGVYEYQIEIQDNMDLTPYINCLSSFLIVESPTLNKGIDLTFKRVPHYNEHNDKDRLILNLVHQKKSLREIKHLLTKNFKLSIEQSETAINTCLQNAQTEISVFGKQKTTLKDHPGIDISIERQNLSYQTSIVVKDISHIDYFFIIHKYINSLFYLTHYPTPQNELLCPPELTSTVNIIPPTSQQSRILTNQTTNINDLLYDDDDEEDEDDALGTIDEFEDEDDEDDMEEDGYFLFSYGSNHTQQLEERLNRSPIQCYKGFIDNYERIFGGNSQTWNGAVASIIETQGEICKGAYCKVSQEELNTLDDMETTYTRIELPVTTENDTILNAWTYIKEDTEWNDHPSKAYLEACYKTIQPFWDDTTIVVKDEQTTVKGIYNATENSYSEQDSNASSLEITGDQLQIEESSDSEPQESTKETSPLEVGDQVNIESSSPSPTQVEPGSDAVMGEDQVNIESSSESQSDDSDAKGSDTEGSDTEQEEASTSDDEREEEPQRGGMKQQSSWQGVKLSSPGPFALYAQELDENLYKPIKELDKSTNDMYLTKQGAKTYSYARACPSNLKRQPVILSEKEYQNLIKSDPEYTLITEENFEDIKKMNPNKYSKLILKYGSDPNNMFYYICPRYWCLTENRPLTQEQVDNNECGGNVISRGAKKVPENTFIYSFNSDYTEDPKSGEHTIQTYPGFLKGEQHPKGFCLPCCMKGAIADKFLTKFKPCSKGGVPEDNEQVDNKTQLRILAPDKFPLENMKYGYLTLSLESFLKIKSSEFQDKNNISVKFNHPSILRVGVDKGKHKQDSFLGCIALAYSLHTKTPLVKPEAFRQILADTLTLDQFVEYYNGNLVSLFYKENARHKHTLPKSKQDATVLNLDLPKSTIDKLIISYNAYKTFILEHTPLDYEYLWDYICDLLDCNLIILHKSNDDITDKIEIVCPSNAYSNSTYHPKKKSLILYLEHDTYEPIVEYTLYNAAAAKKHKKKTDVNLFFQEKYTHKHIIKLLKDTHKIYQHHCKPVKSTEEIVFTPNLIASVLREYLNIHHYTVDYDIIGYSFKIVAFMVSKNGKRSIVPCYPSNIELELPLRFIEDERNWVHYEMSRDFLVELYTKSKKTKHPVPCNPVSKIIDETNRIIGIYTMTGQFVQVNPVVQSDIVEDSLIPIYSQHNYNEEDKMFHSTTRGDVKREQFVRSVKLEQGFYLSFRNTLKWLVADNSYHEDKVKIQTLINSSIPYKDKLTQMVSLLQSILANYVVFTSMKDTKQLDQIEMCCNKINKASCNKTGSFCIYSNTEQRCTLHIPKENLQHKKDNEELYYTKLADELIRYVHYQQYILNTNNSTMLHDVEYRINDNEIILLESTLLSNYFKDLKPTHVPKNIVNRTYDTTQPLETIQYDLTYIDPHSMLENSIETQKTEGEPKEKRVSTERISSCKSTTKELTDFFKKNKTPFFLQGCREDLYTHQEKENCVFILFIEICKIKQIPFYTKAYNESTKAVLYKSLQGVIIRYITTYILDTGIGGFQPTHNKHKQLQLIYKTQRKRSFVKQIKANIDQFSLLVKKPDYYWTNLDLWILATKEKIPIILINKSEFFELSHMDVKVKNILLLYHNPDSTNYIILRQDKKAENDAYFGYGLVHKDNQYLFTENTLPEDTTIKTAIQQYIPLDKWFTSFISIL